MKYLAINTAVKTEALISSLGDNANNDYYFSSAEKSVAGVQLLPQIDIMLTAAGKQLKDLDFFACVIGPGSFTGIRIGVSAVRALSYALNKPIVPIIYFDVLAYNTSAPFTAAVDGGNGVCYIKNYGPEDSEPKCIKAAEIKSHSCGEIVADSFFSESVNRIIKDGALPLKSAVEKAAAQNKFIGYDRLQPLYLRRSQPEREIGEL